MAELKPDRQGQQRLPAGGHFHGTAVAELKLYHGGASKMANLDVISTAPPWPN